MEKERENLEKELEYTQGFRVSVSKKLENERFEMLLEVRQVLTYEQWQKIEEINRRIKQMRSERRPGARGQEGQRPQGDRAPGF